MPCAFAHKGRACWSTLVATAALLISAAHPALALTQAYVANLGSDSVSIVDADSGVVTETIPVGQDPDGIAVTADGRWLYVANFVSDSVSVIDISSRAIVQTIAVGDGPVGVALSPDETSLYVANKRSDSVSVIDVASLTVTATITAGHGPNGIAVSPDGAVVYVTDSLTKDPGQVSVIDVSAAQRTGAINVGRSPGRVAFSADGRRAYVTNFRSWNVSVIDTLSRTSVATVPVFGRPASVAVDPNGVYRYVSTLGGRVHVIDAATNTTTALIAVGEQPYGIAISCNGGIGFVTNFDSNSASIVELGEQVERVRLPVGAMPFAVAAASTSCDEPTHTPRPSVPTPTPSPAATATGSPAAPTFTPRSPGTPTPSPHMAAAGIALTDASGLPGGGTEFSATLLSSDVVPGVAGAQDDVGYDPSAIRVPPAGECSESSSRCTADHDCPAGQTCLLLGPDCTVNPEIRKPDGVFGYQPPGCNPQAPAGDPSVCHGLRAVIFALNNPNRIIPSGATLYTCRVEIPGGTAAGRYALHGSNIILSYPSPPGGQVCGSDPTCSVQDGAVIVAAAAARTAGSRGAAAQSEIASFAIPLSDSRPIAIASRGDGSLWFTDSGVDRLGHVTPEGGITLYPLPDLSGPAGIAEGADGNLWFVNNDRNRIARFAPDAQRLVEFTLPTAGSQPFGITAGSDGALWFTEIGAGKIGRITFEGNITEFALPQVFSAPAGITAGAGGSLWFTEFNGNRIGRITVQGEITEFPLPSPGSGPLGITAQPGGDVWFTEFSGGRVGRITTNGTIIEFALPIADSGPAGITAADDGNLWFTEVNADQVGRVTPSGQISEFALTPGSFEGGSLFGGGIAASADGGIWVAENGAGRIARVETSQAPLPSASPTLIVPAATLIPESTATRSATPAVSTHTPDAPTATPTPVQTNSRTATARPSETQPELMISDQPPGNGCAIGAKHDSPSSLCLLAGLAIAGMRRARREAAARRRRRGVQA